MTVSALFVSITYMTKLVKRVLVIMTSTSVTPKMSSIKGSFKNYATQNLNINMLYPLDTHK